MILGSWDGPTPAALTAAPPAPAGSQSAYPYRAGGKMGATPETNFVVPLIALATVAADTKTLHLGAGVQILPQSNPRMLAASTAVRIPESACSPTPRANAWLSREPTGLSPGC
jgi:hypothetical protein